MERNLQRIGGSLFVSLPNAWAKDFRLKPGSKVHLDINDRGQLCIGPSAPAKRQQTRTVLEYGQFLFREMMREYLYGTQVIVVEHAKAFSSKERKEVISYAGRLMNAEIIEESAAKIVIQHFHSDEVTVDALIRRLYYLTHSMLADLAEAKEIEAIVERDAMVGRLYLNIIMQLRQTLTGKSMKADLTEILDLRLFIERIERIGDEIKHIARDMLAGKRPRRADLLFLCQRYEEAAMAYFEKNVVVARRFWSTEEQDRKRLRGDDHLLRLYDQIKDIADLVI
jgi:phosphate uptake regulator